MKKTLAIGCIIALLVISLVTNIFAFEISDLFNNQSSEEITKEEFSNACNVLSNAGILKDIDTFDSSNQNLTRAMLVAFLGRLSGESDLLKYVAKQDINMYLTKNVESLNIVTIKAGQEFILIDRTDNWYKVEFGNKQGYIPDTQIDSSINIYSDVDAFAYYMPYLSWAIKNDIITLSDSFSFSPDNYITREAFCFYLQQYLKYKGIISKSGNQEVLSIDVSIRDEGYIDSIYYNSVISALNNGYIRADSNGNVNPKKYITRKQAIFFLASLYNDINSSNKEVTANNPTVLDRTSFTDGAKYENITAPASEIKVGLYYGDHMLSVANFSNSIGTGFRIGFYNEDGFIPIIDTSLESISIIAEKQNNIDADSVYYPYHLIVATNYISYAEAAEAASAYENSFVGYIYGYYKILFGFYGSQESATIALNILKYADEKSKNIRLQDKELKSYNINIDVYSPGDNSFVVLDSTSYPVLVINSTSISSIIIKPDLFEGYAETWLSGYKYCGTFKLSRYNSYLSVINVIDVENYVKGVLPYEMESGWPTEALKAQAVCIRSYAMTHLNDYIEWGFDLTDNVESQVYRGTTNAQPDTDAAVDATCGQYLRYEGNICNAMYSSSDGGSTESFCNIFSVKLPYLTGIQDPFESSTAMDYYNKKWSYTRTGEDLQNNLSTLGFNLSNITAVKINLSETNNVIRVNLFDDSGALLSLSKDKIRSFLDLPSCHFTCTQNNNSFVFSGGGWGHNVGMSQWGAYIMAKEYGYSYTDILCFYFQGAYVM